MRNYLLSSDREEDLYKNPNFYHSVFATLHEIEDFQLTQTSRDNLAEKRYEKRNRSIIPTAELDVEWVGPSAPIRSAEEATRVASISNPKISSTGGQRFHATQEKESELLANLFCNVTLGLLYENRCVVKWANGRTELPILKWRQRYSAWGTSPDLLARLPQRLNLETNE